MRIDMDDPGSDYSRIAVYVDGVLQVGAVMADEEQGVAEITETEDVQANNDGFVYAYRVIPDPDCPRGFRTRMVWGKVEIRQLDVRCYA